MSEVARILAQRRLSSGTERRHTFTVARSEALIRMRQRPQEGPWHWTLDLLRATHGLGPGGRARFSSGGRDGPAIIRLERDDVEWAELSLVGILYAGLAADLGIALDGHGGMPLPDVWRQRVGRAINLSLAHNPPAVELLTPAAGRRFESIGEGRYAERVVHDRSSEGGFELRVHRSEGAFTRVGAWLRGKSDEANELTALWLGSLPGSNRRQTARGGIDLPDRVPGHLVRLGSHALWIRDSKVEGLWLLRDGVRALSLGTRLARAGLHGFDMPGFIDCPGLRLTADEGDVARDAAFDLLVAWLHDARAHTFPGEDEEPTVVWPAQLSHLSAVSGRPVPLHRLADQTGDRDLLFIWPHREQEVPPRMRASVYRLWPSELRILRTAMPQLRPVAVTDLGEKPQIARDDLTGLEQGSVQPAFKMRVSEASLDSVGPLRLRARAFVHRYPTATSGSVLFLVHGRKIARFDEAQRVTGGITVVCAIEAPSGEGPVPMDTLRADRPALTRLAETFQEELRQRRSAVLDHVFRHVRVAWDVPVVRQAVDGLGPLALGLHYSRRPGSPMGLVLGWSDSALLGLVVAHDKDRRARTLGDALTRCRDVGGIVVAANGSRWRTLESGARGLDTWKLTAAGARVLPRVVGDGCLWKMPTVPESHPMVAPVTDQRHLQLEARDVGRLLGRVEHDPGARIAVLGHMLVSREQGHDSFELEQARLVRRYDPRALAPVRLVSLAALEAADDRPPAAFPGAVSRDLAGPVLELTPPEAALLHRVLDLEPASPVERGARLARGRTPRRRRGRAVAPLVEISVVDPLMVGALRLEAHRGGGAVALWSAGLHADDLRLEGPLAAVSGRLWLTPRGSQVGRGRLDVALRAWVVRLVRTARTQQQLLRPADPRRTRVERFVAACLADPELGPDLSPILPRGRDPMLSLHRSPLTRVPSHDPLLNVLRQVVGSSVQVETAVLSWRPAKVVAPGGPRMPPGLELGRRHAWIRRGLDPEASLPRVFEAAAVALADAWSQVDAGPLAPGPVTGVQLYRLLALAYVHG